ncbi:MAG: plastocyanin/azurin family copper-binding protein, partial [Halobaculum sp.]
TPTATATEGPDPTVTVPGLEFDPLRLSVDPGATVAWVNQSGTHDVTSAQFHEKAVEWSFQSQTFSSGERVSYTFESEGVYEYFCSIHGRDTMSGAILVGDVTLDETLPSESSGRY